MRPPDSWLYTSYKDYRLADPGPEKELLAAGSVAPQWTLALANGGSSKNYSLAEVLNEPSTKLVLIEFWISHCGYSIDAVPKLNALTKRFGPSGMKLLAINSNDSEDTIQAFAKTHGPHYTLIANGAEVARQYGVSAYPAVFLVNSDGKVVYAAVGLDDEEVSAKIAALLR